MLVRDSAVSAAPIDVSNDSGPCSCWRPLLLNVVVPAVSLVLLLLAYLILRNQEIYIDAQFCP